MYYTIYKISNKINGRFYIGAHKTKNLNDTYMGSGKILLRAQNKYGIDNFTKEILHIFDNSEAMFAKEAEIVNDDYLMEENTYNLKVGGFGGFSWINNNLSTEDRRRFASLGGLAHHISDSELSERISTGIKKSSKCGNGSRKVKELYPNGPMSGKAQSVASKKKLSDSWKTRKLIKCPHCQISSKNAGNMKRWHFDKCKQFSKECLDLTIP